MEEKLALLRTIAANPDDDTPRLIYADWLDETGDETNRARAELIRLDIHINSLPPGSEERRQMRSHDWARMLPLASAWWSELPVLDGVTWGWFERGFVEHVSTRYTTLLETRERIFEAAPIVSLSLNGINPWAIEDLCHQPWMERITRLELNGSPIWMDEQRQPLLSLTMTTVLVDLLVNSPFLTRLRRLAVRRTIGATRGQIARLKRRFGEVVR